MVSQRLVSQKYHCEDKQQKLKVGVSYMKKVLISIIVLFVIVAGIATYFVVVQNNQISTLNKDIDGLNLVIKDLEQKNSIMEQELESSKNEQDEKLAKKVITQSYNQFIEAGSFSRKEFEANVDKYFSEYYVLNHNMEIISNSYNNGIDADVKNMLNAINKYLDTMWIGELEYEAMTDTEKSDYWGTNLVNGYKSTIAINNCISKYALFDEIGLKETS